MLKINKKNYTLFNIYCNFIFYIVNTHVNINLLINFFTWPGGLESGCVDPIFSVCNK